MPTPVIHPPDEPLTDAELRVWPFILIPVGILLIVLGLSL